MVAEITVTDVVQESDRNLDHLTRTDISQAGFELILAYYMACLSYLRFVGKSSLV